MKTKLELSKGSMADKWTKKWGQLPHHKGQGLVEYALILSLVSLAVVFSFSLLSTAISSTFSQATNALISGISSTSGDGGGSSSTTSTSAGGLHGGGGSMGGGTASRGRFF